MKKKVVLLVVPLMLFLTGCEAPESLQAYDQWREMFFLPNAASGVLTALRGVLEIVIFIALVISLKGVVRSLKGEENLINSDLVSGISILFGVGLYYSFFGLTKGLGGMFLPQDITLGKIAEVMHWDIPNITEAKNLIDLWALNFTISLPIAMRYYQVFMLLVCLDFLFISSIRHNNRGALSIIALCLVFGFSMAFYGALIQVLEVLTPDWDSALTRAVVDICYMMIGSSIFIIMNGCTVLALGVYVWGKDEIEKQPKQQRSIDIPRVLAYGEDLLGHVATGAVVSHVIEDAVTLPPTDASVAHTKTALHGESGEGDPLVSSELMPLDEVPDSSPKGEPPVQTGQAPSQVPDEAKKKLNVVGIIASIAATLAGVPEAIPLISGATSLGNAVLDAKARKEAQKRKLPGGIA